MADSVPDWFVWATSTAGILGVLLHLRRQQIRDRIALRKAGAP